MFKKGDIVVLNNAGKDCYQRNINYKSIPENKLMKIKSHQGFDNGRDIWEVEWKDKTDYYFEYCLERLNMGKIAE
tara:strand:+ start:284 stop:508 length:225 start_codon:yes stop_codon:yes gene_type:complete